MSNCATCGTPLGTPKPDGARCVVCRVTAERDEALAVLRAILADYNERQWVDVDVADRARALLAKAEGKEGKT